LVRASNAQVHRRAIREAWPGRAQENHGWTQCGNDANGNEAPINRRDAKNAEILVSLPSLR